MAKLYNIKPERISHFVEFDVINAIKFIIYWTSPGGSPGESDILGCQHYGPLMDIEVGGNRSVLTALMDHGIM